MNNRLLDPVYIPNPCRKLPKPIGFELNCNPKISPPKKIKNLTSPPGLGSTKDQLEWRRRPTNSAIKNKRIILPDRRFSRDSKNKLKLYKQEKVSGRNSPEKNVWIKMGTKHKKTARNQGKGLSSADGRKRRKKPYRKRKSRRDKR